MTAAIDLNAIRKSDAKTKPPRADSMWTELSSYFDDTARALTLANLQRLGLGLRENIHPIEVNYLAYIMGRLSVVYSDSAARWLVKASAGEGEGRRLKETNPQHKLLTKLYARAKIDIAMREAAVNAALLGQVAIRLYPIDSRRSVSPRLFRPQHVLRDVNPGAADQLAEDKRFALELAGDVFECWERTSDGWRMQWLTKKGEPLPDEEQPFGASGISPYEELPVLILYDRWPGGHAWLPPKASRVSLVSAINAALNDLMNLCALQGHGQWVYKREDPNSKIPDVAGAGAVWEVGAEDDVQNITPQTNIDAVRECIREYIAQFLSSEGLPADELERDRQIYSGAQLQVAERPLNERREAQLPMATEAEGELKRSFSSVHNVHAGDWDEDELEPELEVSVEFGAVDTPVDEKDLTETVTNQLASRLISPIDAIRRVHRCTRAQAIQIHERIAEDFDLYPLKPEATEEEEIDPPEGTQADPTALDAVNALNQENADSMTDAANGITSGERREMRR